MNLYDDAYDFLTQCLVLPVPTLQSAMPAIPVFMSSHGYFLTLAPKHGASPTGSRDAPYLPAVLWAPRRR